MYETLKSITLWKEEGENYIAKPLNRNMQVWIEIWTFIELRAVLMLQKATGICSSNSQDSRFNFQQSNIIYEMEWQILSINPKSIEKVHTDHKRVSN